MELTDKQILYYEEKALDLERDLMNVIGSEWNVIFDKDWLIEDTQKPKFNISKDNMCFDVDMNGKIDIDFDDNYYVDYVDIEPLLPNELILIGTFAKKLKNNNL